MLRNSTEKYKRMYGSTPIKDSKTMTVIGTPTKFDTQSGLNYSTRSLSNLKNSSTKKLQSFTPVNQKYNLIYKFGGESREQDSKLRKTLKKCSNVSKKPQQKVYRTCQDNFFEEQAKQVEAVRSSEDFIQNLPKNTLFYCTHCFQFIFEIEKKRHYPQCKDVIVVKNRQNQQFYELAKRKLITIVQLSKYTETKAKEIQQLYEYFEHEKFQLIEKVKYPITYQYFKLNEIEMAFAHAFRILLKDLKVPKEAPFFTCF